MAANVAFRGPAGHNPAMSRPVPDGPITIAVLGAQVLPDGRPSTALRCERLLRMPGSAGPGDPPTIEDHPFPTMPCSVSANGGRSSRSVLQTMSRLMS